jgi:hypothetical protein
MLINVVHIINDLKLDYALHYRIIKGETLKTLILFWCLLHDYFVDYYNSNAFFGVVRLLSTPLEWLKDTSPLILNQTLSLIGVHKGEL